MASAWSYTTLKAAIKSHCEDNGTNFDAQVDNLIKLGEDRVVKDLPLAIFDSRSNVTITQGSQIAAKPANAIATRELTYVNGGATVILKPRTYGYLRAYCANTNQAPPKYFSEDYAEAQYWLAPNPNVTVTAEALITARPASIVTATNTFLGTNAGDLLLAACMLVAERFNLGWDESKNWGAEYIDLLKSARLDFRQLLRRDYATLAPQPMAAGKGER